MSMKLMWPAPAIRAVCPGRASRSTVRQPSSGHGSLGVVPGRVGGDAGPDGVVAGHGEFGVIGEELEGGAWQADAARRSSTAPRRGWRRPGSARRVRHHSRAALPPKEWPNAPTRSRSRCRAVRPARFGRESSEVIGDGAKVRRLVRRRRPLDGRRPRRMRAGRRSERAGEGGRVHGQAAAVGEDGDGALVGVGDTDDDVAVAGQLLGGAGEEQRGEAAGRHDQHGTTDRPCRRPARRRWRG